MENSNKTKSTIQPVSRQSNDLEPAIGFETLGESLHMLDICVLVFDETGRTVYSSPHLEELLGSVPAAVGDLAAAIAEKPDDLDKLTTGLARVHESSESFSMQLPRVTCADGAHACHLTAFRSGAGGSCKLVVLLRDVTVEHKMRKEIEILDRQASAGRVAAGVAHEFNNILTAMLGWTQIAKRTTSGDDHTQKALTTLEQNAHRARQIASQLLDISRPDDVPDHYFPAEAPLEEALSLLRWELSDAGVKVTRKIAATDRIRGDTTRLIQLFINLVRNAMDAMPDGGSLLISLVRQGHRIKIVFADDGIGIDPAITDRIFEPFFSTKNTRKRHQTGGRGLGLAISREIVEEHGGTISAAPNERGGTSIIVTLPASNETLSTVSEPPATRSSFPPGVSVLVVDDDLDIREMINTALTLRGADVAIAADGSEAVALCTERSFDAAFVDFSMFGLSGYELGKALTEVQPRLPIVYMSGRVVGFEGHNNVTDFLKKPFDLHEIQRKLRQVLDRGSNG